MPTAPGGSTINGFTPGGNQNNPGILPLESDNFDISVEYYFSDTGYVSVGAFQKNVENFIGNSVDPQNLYGIRNQTGGPRAIAARDFLVANGFVSPGGKFVAIFGAPIGVRGSTNSIRVKVVE